MPTREPAPPRSWPRRHPWALGLGAVLVLAVLVTWALGGLARTSPDGPRVVPPGTEVEVAPFAVRLDRAEAAYEVGGRPAEPGQAFLVVEGTLRLTAAEAVTYSTLRDLFVAELASSYDAFGEPSDEPEAAVIVAEDGSTLLGLGPGLTYDVQVTYTVDEATMPDRLELALREHRRRRSSIDDTLGWYDPVTAALLTLDVAPLPDERPKAEF